jgi:formyltetrahydrofolate deformylase
MGEERDMLLRLLISYPDRPGIVSAVSRFLYESGANLVRSDQYSTDPEGVPSSCGWNSRSPPSDTTG